jgi:type II secretory ATPase GspE/PulE/Tfp pilus assembly ATPase PilB-like protein
MSRHNRQIGGLHPSGGFDLTGVLARPNVSMQSYDALDTAIYCHLANVLGLADQGDDSAILFDFLSSEHGLEPAACWQRESFLEWYARKADLDLNVLLTKVIRETSVVPFDPALLGVSPKTVQLPPLAVPFVPISRRESEVTILSWVPGLEALLRVRGFERLNAFWGVDQINVLWSDPAPLREAIKQLPNLVDFRPVDQAIINDVGNGGVPWIDLDGVNPAEKTNHWFSPALQRRYQACPVYCGKKVLTLAVTTPLDPVTKAEIEGALRHRFSVQQVLADPVPLQRFIAASESKAINTAGMVRAMVGLDRQVRDIDPLEIIQADKLQESPYRAEVDEQAVIKFVHSILYKGVDLGASDIMFQEFPQRLRVRYKVDGDWFDENGEFPGHIAKQIISRIKVISGLEIQYMRLPQDGTFPIKIGDQRYDFRVNTSYQSQGEQAVLRLQRDQRHVKSLAELGMPTRYTKAIDDLMNGDNGLLILCGPTGSGKTTTIYSILRSIDALKNNVLTAESPIEVLLENISQTQIDDDGPYSYALWARGILRQAPDIVMMGEIRDEESVDALMRLSSSGHRAISTLHTNSACEVPNRFFLFHAQPFMVADSLKMAISQRLVKKVCPRCYIEEPVPSEQRLHRLGIRPEWLNQTTLLRRGRKCDFCRQTGVSGRKAIFEALIVDDEVKLAIQEQAPAVQLRRILDSKGESTLFQKAVQEAAAGTISLEEACKFREVGISDSLRE